MFAPPPHKRKHANALTPRTAGFHARPPSARRMLLVHCASGVVAGCQIVRLRAADSEGLPGNSPYLLVLIVQRGAQRLVDSRVSEAREVAGGVAPHP